jgi:hypothetical protein
MRQWPSSRRHFTDLNQAYLPMFCNAQSSQPRSGQWLQHHPTEENDMSIGTIILIILVLALIGVLPSWPHSRSWGYGPTGGFGLIVVVLVILVLMGKV